MLVDTKCNQLTCHVYTLLKLLFYLFTVVYSQYFSISIDTRATMSTNERGTEYL